MINRGLTLLLSIVFIAFCATADARNTSQANKSKPQKTTKVSTEFGLGVLGKYTFLDIMPVGDFPHTVTANFGVGASLQFRLNFGKHFGLQPEVQYSYSKIKFTSTNGAYDSVKVKDNLVQMPVLLSFRMSVVSLNFGPVFRLADNPTYLLSNEEDNTLVQQQLLNLVPLVAYTAGFSIKLSKKMEIDVRYMGQFKDIKETNAFLGTLVKAKQPTAHEFRTRCQSVQLRFGVVF